MNEESAAIEEESPYSVRCDETTNTPESIAQGRVQAVITVDPSKMPEPARSMWAEAMRERRLQRDRELRHAFRNFYWSLGQKRRIERLHRAALRTRSRPKRRRLTNKAARIWRRVVGLDRQTHFLNTVMRELENMRSEP